jgi:ABC-type branched-subunit amino acid transport system ATPase component
MTIMTSLHSGAQMRIHLPKEDYGDVFALLLKVAERRTQPAGTRAGRERQMVDMARLCSPEWIHSGSPEWIHSGSPEWIQRA